MPAQNASAAAAAAAHVYIEAPDQRAHGWQVLLILGRHARVLDGPAAVWTCVRHRTVVGLCDAGWHAAASLAAVDRTGLTPRPTRARRWRTFREGGRLAEAGPPSRLELVSQPLVLAPQPVPFSLKLPSFLFEPRTVRFGAPQFISELSDDVLGVARRRVVHAACYATFRVSVQAETG